MTKMMMFLCCFALAILLSPIFTAAANQGGNMEKVIFKNAEIAMAGNLFFPAGFDQGKKYKAIVVIHPGGGVKEQTAGVYAQQLARKGFVTLAYDASHQGESGGLPRHLEDPLARVEDIRSAVDYLTTLTYVDRERIGALGICAGGSYAVNAAQTESRIKAVAGVSTVDIGKINREGLDGSVASDARRQLLAEVAAQRTNEANGEEVKYVGYVPDSIGEIDEKSPILMREAYDYYRTPRGRHPNSANRMLFTSLDRIMAFFPFAQVETLSPRPLLMIAGSDADTLHYSQDAINQAKEPRELFLIKGASHVALYDQPEFVTRVADKLFEFFNTNL